MSLSREQYEISPVFSYHLLRNALHGFKKNLRQLDPNEYKQVYRKARKSFELESLVLASSEAKGIITSKQLLDLSVAEVASRYESSEDFNRDLQANGLDETGLRQALYRELIFDSVMQRVAAKSAAITELDMRLYYEMHHKRFQVPEQRVARHILVTVNPDYAENTRNAAHARMEQIVDKLAGRTNRFHDFAKRYSECPTAMVGGKLGDVKPGQLYAVLDSVLFNMDEHQISPIIESELGFHILLCEKIKPGKRLPFSKVAARILTLLQERRRRNCQKVWLATLQKASKDINTINE